MLNSSEDMVIKVLKAAPVVNKGESKDFDCPLCGQEKAMNASKDALNGHLWIKCRKCGFAMGS